VTVETHDLDDEVVDKHGDAPSGVDISDAEASRAAKGGPPKFVDPIVAQAPTLTKEGGGLAFSRAPTRDARQGLLPARSVTLDTTTIPVNNGGSP
jgi:hypothetical protein